VSSERDNENHRRGMFREVNDQIAALEPFLVDGRLAFVCECGDSDCMTPIELTPAEYQDVRAHPRHFVIAIHHENPEVEIVVSHNTTFAVVEAFSGS
jgi:hypothetical protein